MIYMSCTEKRYRVVKASRVQSIIRYKRAGLENIFQPCLDFDK